MMNSLFLGVCVCMLQGRSSAKAMRTRPSTGNKTQLGFRAFRLDEHVLVQVHRKLELSDKDNITISRAEIAQCDLVYAIVALLLQYQPYQ